MKFKKKDKDSPALRWAAGADNASSEALLRAEIGFWRDLLRECGRSVPDESIERMQQALALAEHRFLQLQSHNWAVSESNTSPLRTSPAKAKYLH